ncbi:MAG: hypothetical protein MUQ32_12665 [Chloroflexi bacterium]|nr:hypothetical protein [Chloroflexota bacterium]
MPGSRLAPRPLLLGRSPTEVHIMHFYELHEGDNDIFADLLLAREEEMDAEDFFDLVQSIRRRVQDTHVSNTLVEAIAEELERDYEFVAISDDRLTAAVNVSKEDEENFLADLDTEEEGVDYATILADLEPGDPRLN